MNSEATPMNQVVLKTRVPQKMPNTQYVFKICLIGEGGTGKTTFINKALNGDFITEYFATQGAVAHRLRLNIGDNSEVAYYVWDTAGQEKNVGLKDGYYVDAIAGFFFFDVNSRESMASIPKYLRDFQRSCDVENPLMYILGNKVDLAKKRADVSRLLSSIKSYNAELIQISAKTGHNFDVPFTMLTRALFNDPNLTIEANIDMTPLDNNYDFLATEDNNAVPADIANAVFDKEFN